MNNIELKELRLSLGLSQKEMAAKIGIKWRMYAYVEAGTKPMSTASAMLATNLRRSLPISN